MSTEEELRELRQRVETLEVAVSGLLTQARRETLRLPVIEAKWPERMSLTEAERAEIEKQRARAERNRGDDDGSA